MLRMQVDVRKLRSAWMDFNRDFPDAALLRHAVSHLGDQLSAPEKVAELRRLGEFLMWETQIGTHFTMASRAGRQVRLDVDERTEERLRTVLAEVCDGFAGADPVWMPMSWAGD